MAPEWRALTASHTENLAYSLGRYAVDSRISSPECRIKTHNAIMISRGFNDKHLYDSHDSHYKKLVVLIPQNYPGKHGANGVHFVSSRNSHYFLYCPISDLHAFFNHLLDLLHNNALFGSCRILHD
jgi:hypothetical protein